MTSFQFVAKEIEQNKQFMVDEIGATISFDIDFREIVVLNRTLQLYYVNGLVDDTIIVHLLKELVNLNDYESENDNIFEIVKNRLVNQQVDEEKKMSTIVDQLLSGLVIV